MRLLLDEMWPREIAAQLRGRGLDVIAATESEHTPRYRGFPDDEVFRRAQEDRRAVVTDNIADYEPIRFECEGRGEAHYGLIYALRPQFDRSQPGIIGAMVRSLERLLRSPEAAEDSFNRAYFLRRAD